MGRSEYLPLHFLVVYSMTQNTMNDANRELWVKYVRKVELVALVFSGFCICRPMRLCW